MKLTLDHVALVTPDLGQSKNDYETLGFQLTRESSHKGRVTPDGPIVPWGSGNHCAMFERGYYEILGLTDPNRYHEHFKAALDRFHGVSLIALGCDDAATFYAERKDRTPGLQKPVEVGRDVPYGQSTREGLFRIAHLGGEAFPEAELFFIEQATPSVLWQKKLMKHKNGVVGLAGITICSENPEETAARFERCTGLGGTAVDGEPYFSLDEGYVAITEPGALAKSYPEAVLSAVPSVALVRLDVVSVDETRSFLEKSGVTPHASEAGIWVRPERTGGVILEFGETS